MENLMLSNETRKQLAAIISKNIDPESGRKMLEFGSCSCSAAEFILDECDYLALTDKDPEFLKKTEALSSEKKIQLIPDDELQEDCYFGRFHLVYTLFGFRGLPHLVDEIMRLRRLIIKGGKMLVIDLSADGAEQEYIKQLKRCGFSDITTEAIEIDSKPAFMITTRK